MHAVEGNGATTTPLRQARVAAQLSQRALAAAVGISGSWIGAIDSGAVPVPAHLATRLATVLAVPLGVLLGTAVAPTELFSCRRTHCRLMVSSCIQRQARNERRAGRGVSAHRRGLVSLFPSCSGCVQGALVRMAALPSSSSATIGGIRF